MSKVKVGKEVFDALESTKKWEVDREGWEVTLLRHHIGKDFMDIRDVLNNLDLNCFFEILKNGYELELTPHEKVLGDYNELKYCLSFAKDIYEEEAIENSMKTIVTTLNNLEIYIEGVNK